MPVIRIKHNRENPFVQLNKEALWDKDLSTKAVGLWAKCMSKPDNWTFSVKELSSKIKEGRDFVYSAIKELIKFGYCIRVEVKNSENNRFEKYEYIFFEFKLTPEEIKEYVDNLKKSLPHTGFQEAEIIKEKPLTAFPEAENQTLVIYKDKDIEKKVRTYKSFRRKITFNELNGSFDGITLDILEDWKKKFTNLDFNQELIKASSWITENYPYKKDKKNWIDFLENWFSRSEAYVVFKENENKIYNKLLVLHKAYKNWYENLKDPILINKGFLVLEIDNYYELSKPQCKYKLNEAKFIDMLRNKFNVPERLFKESGF